MGERFLTRGFIAFSAALVAAIWIPSAFAGNVRGDFDGDGYADLAIGAPWEDLGFQEDAGVVTVLYGSAEWLSATDSQRWNQNVRGIQDEAEIGDWFGRDLAAGDFDGDGFPTSRSGSPVKTSATTRHVMMRRFHARTWARSPSSTGAIQG